jgi:hypothetical protein
MSRARPLLLALAAGIALADASIVTLALPSIVVELDTTVEGAAAVIGVYTAVLAGAVLLGGRAPRAGLVVFAAGSVVSGVAGSIELLIAGRALQAAGAGLALPAIHRALQPAHASWWSAAAVFGLAAGPAIGGALTEALDWRAIFLAQAPIGLLAAPALNNRGQTPFMHAPERGEYMGSDPGYARVAGAVALGLVSAALTAVLFLLVLLLVAGWSLSPLAAAAVVSVLPVCAIAAARVGGEGRAALGCALVGAGVLALASVPDDSIWRAVVAQVPAGIGMGLALPALSHGDAARQLAVRHVGITLALAILAPVAADRLDHAITDTRERGAALVLDAELNPLDKISLAGVLVADVDVEDPRDQLGRALADHAGDFDGEEAAAYAELRRRADETLVAAVNDAFVPSFLITGALALLAAVLLRPPVFAVAVLLLPLTLTLVSPSLEPEPVRIADPCRPRDLPGTGGLTGFAQDAALTALDRAACRFGSTREELAVALADGDAADAFEREHGVDPRSVPELLRGIIGL